VIQIATETFVTAFMIASAVGAGIVIVFFALIASMTDRTSERKTEKTREEPDETARIPQYSNASNTPNVNEAKNFPNYTDFLFSADFILFSLTALFAFNWLSSQPTSRTDASWTILVFFFIASIFLLTLVAGTGILEITRTIKNNRHNDADKR
jgi:NADH:ubiquinone oxidoreductase subunit 3 (subunit A)